MLSVRLTGRLERYRDLLSSILYPPPEGATASFSRTVFLIEVMALFTSGHRRRQPRRFDYEPRFYDPKKEESGRRQIQIERRTLSRRRSPLGIVYFLILLGMVLFIYNMLG